MAAEAFLRTKLDQLANQVSEKYVKYDEDNVHRQIVDLARCLRELRKKNKKINTKLGIDPIPHIVTYLEDPVD